MASRGRRADEAPRRRGCGGCLGKLIAGLLVLWLVGFAAHVLQNAPPSTTPGVPAAPAASMSPPPASTAPIPPAAPPGPANAVHYAKEAPLIVPTAAAARHSAVVITDEMPGTVTAGQQTAFHFGIHNVGLPLAHLIVTFPGDWGQATTSSDCTDSPRSIAAWGNGQGWDYGPLVAGRTCYVTLNATWQSYEFGTRHLTLDVFDSADEFPLGTPPTVAGGSRSWDVTLVAPAAVALDPTVAPAADQPAPNVIDQTGPTALCTDGTYSYSAHHRGTCSHHGGVAAWYR